MSTHTESYTRTSSHKHVPTAHVRERAHTQPHTRTPTRNSHTLAHAHARSLARAHAHAHAHDTSVSANLTNRSWRARLAATRAFVILTRALPLPAEQMLGKTSAR